MARIFISYRRQDSLAIAHRVCERLEGHFGKEQVFIDVDKIPPGVDFRTYLSTAVTESFVVLAVIGAGWLTASDEVGTRRIDDPEDFVRYEIETALCAGILVIPVLIGNAAMPSPGQLPESLRPLSYLNASVVDAGRDFNTHLDRLVAHLEHLGLSPSRFVSHNDCGPADPTHSALRMGEINSADQSNYFIQARRFGIECQFQELRKLRDATGLEDDAKLCIGFWHNYKHTPPLSSVPTAQAFIDSIRSYIQWLTPDDRALLFLQFNVKDQNSDHAIVFPESEVALPGYHWEARVQYYASNSISQFTSLNLDSRAIIENSDRVIYNLTQWITALPPVRQDIQPVHTALANQTRQQLSQVQKEAGEIIRRISRSNFGDDYVKIVHAEIADVARSYNWTPPSKVIASVLPLWHELAPRLYKERPLNSERDLFLLAGQVQGLLSYAALYLNEASDALKCANHSLRLAELAGSEHLKAWACGTLSLILRFDNAYTEALAIAERGLATAERGELRSRLYANAAEAAAHLGQVEVARKYLECSTDECGVKTTSEPLDLPGIFGFPPAKVHYYTGSTLVALEGGRETAQNATAATEKAIKLFGDDSTERSYPDLLVAQAHLAQARLKLRDLDGVVEALAPLLQAAPECTTSWHRKLLRRIAKIVSSNSYTDSRIGKRISDAINEFNRKR